MEPVPPSCGHSLPWAGTPLSGFPAVLLAPPQPPLLVSLTSLGQGALAPHLFSSFL